jgi:hypothetical protein
MRVAAATATGLVYQPEISSVEVVTGGTVVGIPVGIETVGVGTGRRGTEGAATTGFEGFGGVGVVAIFGVGDVCPPSARGASDPVGFFVARDAGFGELDGDADGLFTFFEGTCGTTG